MSLAYADMEKHTLRPGIEEPAEAHVPFVPGADNEQTVVQALIGNFIIYQSVVRIPLSQTHLYYTILIF